MTSLAQASADKESMCVWKTQHKDKLVNELPKMFNDLFTVGVFDNIRSVPREKGIYGVNHLVNLFCKFDTNKDARLDCKEVQWMLKQNGWNLSPLEFDRVGV